MFSNLTLYYLNQLGITPWISKENSLNLRKKTNPVESRGLKLVVLISTELSDKAQSLFNRMMAYINIQNDELLLLNIKQQDFINGTNRDFFSQIAANSPLAVLALGPSAKALFDDFNPSIGVVESLTLDDLLNNPSNKKKAFQDLSYLKQLFS